MICPAFAFSADASAELAEGHEQDALKIPLLLQVRHKRTNGIVNQAHQPIVRSDLPGVGIESALTGVINPRRQSACNHARNQIEASRPEDPVDMAHSICICAQSPGFCPN